MGFIEYHEKYLEILKIRRMEFAKILEFLKLEIDAQENADQYIEEALKYITLSELKWYFDKHRKLKEEYERYFSMLGSVESREEEIKIYMELLRITDELIKLEDWLLDKIKKQSK